MEFYSVWGVYFSQEESHPIKLSNWTIFFYRWREKGQEYFKILLFRMGLIPLVSGSSQTFQRQVLKMVQFH